MPRPTRSFCSTTGSDPSRTRPSGQGSIKTPGLRMPVRVERALDGSQRVGEELRPLDVVGLRPVHATDGVVVGRGAAGATITSLAASLTSCHIAISEPCRPMPVQV